MNILLKMIPELKHASVRMRDGGRVETIIEHMRREGPNALQVISDFDMTLTRFAHNGTRCPTSYGILHSSAVISEDCKAKMSDLFDLYYPVEINNSMSVEEKIPHMEEWSEITPSLTPSSVSILHSSAVISEDCKAKGVVRAFKGDVIHAFNKREGALQNTQQFVHDRSNVLLLGDSLGDLDMADGVQGLRNILRIGYLSDKVEERREAYVRSYDIVLEKDETLDVPNAILNYITAEKRDHAPV
ncbi:7-methylguanosine phosphate-specific 5'-nucleotidase-like [Ictalurus furcatus]|uniref:7-methylguanosine phosphate-specific 5'-nucleotidase-like n=1 Tax=Ictalurus furcatus TaxID=66913 RepID=UPI0023506258|nr:7-methylguanosine phosphate-specific 5'-nucleotidase-like [Ictalurus furcatus]